ncbi:hypothetical protein QBC46DRAFT_221199, partial [Diplogelasinospora grovesii]
KAWTDAFPQLDSRHITVYPPTKESIDNFLGRGLDLVQRPPSEVDDVGLQTQASALNAVPQAISSEGDVERDFYQHFEPAYRLAFLCGPFLWPRSLLGPTGPTNTTITVDYQLTWPGQRQYRLFERVAMIGELKQPSVIQPQEWTTNQPWGQITKRLQREMRG